MTVKIMPNPPTRPRNLKVVALAYDGLCTFEFGVAVELFGLPRPEMGPDWYAFATAAIEPGPLRGLGGVQVVADGGLELASRPARSSPPAGAGPTRPCPSR
jgi:AraC family transcriptional activator FtrA